MADPRKRASSGDQAKPKRGPAAARPRFVRVIHSAALHKKTLSVLTAIESATDATEHRDTLSAVIIELINSGLDYCFLQPLKKAAPGFVVEQTASLGLAGAQQLMGQVARQVIGHMNSEQLRTVCASIRGFMR